ncbi:receptor-like protein EIX2, partial [Tanacetum coccineum]
VFRGRTVTFRNTLELIVTIDLSSNELVGQIPEELIKLTELLILNLKQLEQNDPFKYGSYEFLKLSGFVTQQPVRLIFVEIGSDVSSYAYGSIDIGFSVQSAQYGYGSIDIGFSVQYEDAASYLVKYRYGSGSGAGLC